MPNLTPIIEHLGPLLLVASRLMGLFVFSPVMGGALIPRTFKIMLAMMMAVAIYAMLPGELHALPADDLFLLAAGMFTEVLIGVSIGLVATLPLMAVQMGGHILGYQMGLGLAQVYNPDSDANGAVIDQALYLMAMIGFIAMGGLETLFLALVRTFEHVPIGGLSGEMVPLDIFMGVLVSSMELAMQIALPVLAVISLLLVAMGFIMKTMPQINVMSAGFALKILAGVMMLAAVLFVLNDAAMVNMERTLDLLVRWTESLGVVPAAEPLPSPIGGVNG